LVGSHVALKEDVFKVHGTDCQLEAYVIHPHLTRQKTSFVGPTTLESLYRCSLTDRSGVKGGYLCTIVHPMCCIGLVLALQSEQNRLSGNLYKSATRPWGVDVAWSQWLVKDSVGDEVHATSLIW
jgi:hypothetical protein